MNYKLVEVPFEKIKPVTAPLESAKQESLIETEINEEPLRLRPLACPNGVEYEIVNGRRRYVAMVANGYSGPVPALVEDMDDERVHWLSLTLNSGTPNELDEAEHITFLLGQRHTQEQIAKHIGFSQTRVSQRVRLYERLIPELKEKLRKGDINYTTALTATYLPYDEQNKLLNEKRLTRKVADSRVREFKSNLVAERLFDEEEPAVLPGLFLTSEQVQKLLSGSTLQIDWNGKSVLVSATEV